MSDGVLSVLAIILTVAMFARGPDLQAALTYGPPDVCCSASLKCAGLQHCGINKKTANGAANCTSSFTNFVIVRLLL